jgi:hypothetical protein
MHCLQGSPSGLSVVQTVEQPIPDTASSAELLLVLLLVIAAGFVRERARLE